MKAQCTSWTADEDFDGDESLGLRIKEGKEIIAYLPGIGQRDFDNARLIAAAHQLLAALKYARRMVNASKCDIAFIDAAIAKATGGAA